MTNPPIWDAAYELLGPSGEIKAESGGNEIAFREIIEEAPLKQHADAPVKEFADTPEQELSIEEVSFKIIGDDFAFTHRNSIKSAKNLYYEVENNLLNIFNQIKDNRDFSIDPVFSYAQDIVSHIRSQPNTWMQLLYKVENSSDSDTIKNIVKHSLNTSIIAARIGIGLKLRDERLEDLVMQTCFHDVGMLRLPPEIIIKMSKLTNEEMALIKKHPEYGYEIMHHFEGRYKGFADIILQEHERYDGSGYPKGRSGIDIPENSLIIGISDMYTALLQPRPYRPRCLPFEAIKEIISTAKEQFPHNIIKTLVNEFSAFPEGLYVRLNSKEVGKVISVNRLAPLSPVVEILYNAEGKLQITKTVDLMKDHCLYITSGFYGEEE
jgi:HD-GYP domain-containing protein (c-di-GMP phosphodiesterase class II)